MPPTGWRQGEVVQDADAEGGSSLLFTLDQPLGWVQGPLQDLPPGTYTVTYRMKIADTSSRLPVVRLYVNQADDLSSPSLADHTLAPRDFATPGIYQDFTMTFTVKNWAKRVDLGVIPYNSANWDDSQYAGVELWIDWVHLERQGELDFPVFTLLALVMTGGTGSDTLELVDTFESRGILVLTPDEYMAALNPEYMISFASQYLAADDPSLLKAQALLDNSQFFESLMIVRQALKERINR